MIRAMPVLAAALLPAAAIAQSGGTLTIDVGNVRTDKGTVRVDVCPQAKFLKDDCLWAGAAPATIGTTRIIVRDVPAGRYAVQAFLDENGNRKVDRALFGIPKEGVGFSGKPWTALGEPKWADSVFAYSGGNQSIQLNLRYFLGAKGPPARR